MIEHKKPLVALVTNNDDDIYCFRLELIQTLIQEGYEVLISCPDGPKFELMKEIPFVHDKPYIDRRGTNPFTDLKLLLHYFSLFKKYKPSVVLTYTAKPNVYASIAARVLGISYINNVTGLGSVLNKSGLMRRFIMELFGFAYKGAACVMFQNSTNMQLALDAGFIKGEYRLISGSGVNLDRYPVQPYSDGGNGIEGEPVVFNYVGRVLHDKGVDDYIAAAKYIRARYPKTEFNIVGFIEPTESHYERDLAQLEEQGIIIYRGSQQDVKPYIRHAHAIIHPSTYGEGISNVLLEHAASGRPIITTDNPGCRETVLDGESGYIYSGGNVKQLISSIEKFLQLDNSKRIKMGMRGRKFMETKFSRKIVVDEYMTKIKEEVSR